jgi:hypothetical protein
MATAVVTACRSRALRTSVRSTDLANLGPVTDADGAYNEQLALATDVLARLVRRLRSLSRSAWLSRREAVEIALMRLVAITSRMEGLMPRALPSIADHALADAMAVVGGDALAGLEVTVDSSSLADVIAELRAALEATR